MQPIWEPSQQAIEAANLTQFKDKIAHKYSIHLSSYEDLYTWSVEHIECFWQEIWDFCGVLSSHQGEKTLERHPEIEKSLFFPQSLLNYAENLLRPRPHNQETIVFWSENQEVKRLTFQEVQHAVSCLAAHLKSLKINPGDRVAGFLPNIPETIIAMLATASIGAIWTSCSPDFGVQGVVDRFGQTEPKVLFAVDGYYYQGKLFDTRAKVETIVSQLPNLEHVVIIPFAQLTSPNLNRPSTLYSSILDQETPPLNFIQVPFNHPLFILYSSGTTGVPKCIIHGHGGTLLQHLKEHQLHCDIKKGDRVFYFTTCGWMMWNWLASCLASEATVVLYEGAPLYPDPDALFKMVEEEKISLFGVSAKYIDSLRKTNYNPPYNLSSLRMICSTGSPLVSENYDYIYSQLSLDLCLSSMSGGTDIISCFILGNPTGPVWPGELQARGLGLKIEVFDEDGHSIKHQKGELVCTAPFPSMPVGFWNDPTGEKYRNAYFNDFPNVWSHRDYVELTPHNGMIIYGRSDSTLNPGGVRIGTSEIYRQVSLIPDILESVVIGQEWESDVRVILFVKLKPNLTLDDSLKEEIKNIIKNGTTARHVPKKIIQVHDIPHTLTGKIVELAVSDVIHGRPVKNKEALANPEALDYFGNIPDLKTT